MPCDGSVYARVQWLCRKHNPPPIPATTTVKTAHPTPHKTRKKKTATPSHDTAWAQAIRLQSTQ